MYILAFVAFGISPTFRLPFESYLYPFGRDGCISHPFVPIPVKSLTPPNLQMFKLVVKIENKGYGEFIRSEHNLTPTPVPRVKAPSKHPRVQPPLE